jgi:peroxiredoxin
MNALKLGSLLGALLAAPTAHAAPTVQTVKLQESGQARVGNVAPSFGGWDLVGKNVLTFDSLLKKPSPSPLIITFGASWCVPCNVGLPRLVALQKKHSELRLVLIDVEGDAAAAQDFVTKRGMEGPVLLDKFEEVAKHYGLQEGGKLALPRTFLIDAKGRVRAIYRQEGEDFEKVIERDLEAMKNAAAVAPPVTPAK